MAAAFSVGRAPSGRGRHGVSSLLAASLALASPAIDAVASAQATRHRITVTPDTERLYGISESLKPNSLLRIRQEGGLAAGRGARVSAAGASVRIDPQDGPGDTLRTVAWASIEALDLGHRGVQNGIETGARIGAAPGVVILEGGAAGSSPMVAAVALIVGGCVLVGGAVGGAAIGGLVGAGVRTWKPLYTAPQVWVYTEPGAPTVRVVAVGPIHQRSQSVSQRDKEMTASAITALRNSGFVIVDPDSVVSAMQAHYGKKWKRAYEKAFLTPETREALVEKTAADAVIHGVVDRPRHEGDMAHCSFQISDLATGRTLVTAEATATPTWLSHSLSDELASDALGHLRALRDTTRARP